MSGCAFEAKAKRGLADSRKSCGGCSAGQAAGADSGTGNVKPWSMWCVVEEVVGGISFFNCDKWKELDASFLQRVWRCKAPQVPQGNLRCDIICLHLAELTVVLPEDRLPSRTHKPQAQARTALRAGGQRHC